MATVGVLISSLINALIIGWLARRLLGTPVGWPRTLALSLIVNASTAPLLTWALRSSSGTRTPAPPCW